MKDFPSIEPGTYRHGKSGKLYEVLNVALQTETSEALVMYKPMYKCEYAMFARPYEMFVEAIELNGALIPRFEKIDN